MPAQAFALGGKSLFQVGREYRGWVLLASAGRCERRNGESLASGQLNVAGVAQWIINPRPLPEGAGELPRMRTRPKQHEDCSIHFLPRLPRETH